MQNVKNAVMQANALLGESRFEEALALLDTVSMDTEQAGFVSFVRGNIYLQMEQDEQAHLCYSEALNKGFVHKQLYINFGVAKSRMGKIRQAEQMFRQAADLDPTDPMPLNRLLFLRMGTGNLDGAEAVMDELMTRHPELIDGFHHKADLLLGTGRPEEALQLLAGVKERFSSEVLYTYDLCRALGRIGHAEEALQWLEKNEALFDTPLTAELFKKQKASLLLDLSRIEEAMPLWQELYELYGDRQAGLALVTHALHQSETERLCTIADEMLSYQVQDEAHYLCLFYKAMALKFAGDEVRSTEAFRQAAAEYDQMGDDQTGMKFRTLRANIRMELGRYDEAKQDIAFMRTLLQKENSQQVQQALEQLQTIEDTINKKQNAFN